MIDPRYSHRPTDPWTWNRATMSDAGPIARMAEQHYLTEISEIFTPSVPAMTRNVSLDIVAQTYDPTAAFVAVAHSTVTGRLLAYTWCVRDAATWSSDPMLQVKMAHVALDASTRDRVKLLNQMLDQWALFAVTAGINIIASSTVRASQDAFLRLHENRGYTIRGSFAYINLLKLPQDQMNNNTN